MYVPMKKFEGRILTSSIAAVWNSVLAGICLCCSIQRIAARENSGGTAMTQEKKDGNFSGVSFSNGDGCMGVTIKCD